MASICIQETKALFLLVALISFGSCPSEAAAGQINFDDAADGTIVNTRYPGVTFSNPLSATSNIFARSGSGFAPSSPNVVSVFGTPVLPTFDARNGAVDATFASPVASVSIDARPVAPIEFLTPLTRRPFLQAFDAAGNLFTTVYYAGALPTTVSGVGPTETLAFTSTGNNIARVRFSSQNPGNPPTIPPTYGLFDNLRFDRIFMLSANVVSGGSVSPSPASYVDGTLVTLTAIAQPGWRFSNWSGDASGTDNPLQVTMSANKMIVANFVPALPTPEAEICVYFNRGLPEGMTLFGDAQVVGGRLKLYTVGQPNGFGIA